MRFTINIFPIHTKSYKNVFSKPHNTISTLSESTYTNHHTTYTDITNSNKLQSYISNKKRPTQSTLKIFKTKKSNSNLSTKITLPSNLYIIIPVTTTRQKNNWKISSPYYHSIILYNSPYQHLAPLRKLFPNNHGFPPSSHIKIPLYTVVSPRNTTVSTTLSQFYGRNPRP